RVLVWDNLEADPIYEAEQWVDPQYTDANDFFRLELDDAVYVQGEFYVGFRQQEAKKVYIGFDANRSAREHTYYRIGKDWYQSSLNGALMIRPSFNEVELAGVSSPRAVMEANFTVYPNPARDQVQIQTSSKWNSFLLIDISGRLIQSHNGSSRTISLTGLQQGVYFIRGQAENGEMVTTKLVVQP
ncbi:MAG: T9SS C-terminal target domain-containing protein, partial [Euryarchaeota archaeon]|nr:T9SS C-terminal target domain-containing protein [Euryarchaeota archaeon]